MGNNRAKKIKDVRERLKNSFLISEPFAWNYKQAEILEKMLDYKSKCVIVDSLAGTGKTIMSTFAALKLLQKNECKKVFYVRSAVESANSKLQALPGSWEEKIAVYGGPLLDALSKLLNPEETESFLKNKTIEIIPVSYLRGRSFDDCVIIVDESQNYVLSELITIMTRLEESSKLFIIADSEQCDLPKNLQKEFSKMVELFNDKESEKQGIFYYEMRDPELVMRSEFVKFVSKRYSDYKKLINT
jgi:phosphate starvation-inducible PhoH-like protein